MKNGNHRIDSVKLMRQIRDQLSEEFKYMTFEEQKRYMRQQLKSTTTKATAVARTDR
jgi:hypothetical protein